MGIGFSVPCIINPWCWARKVRRMFSTETFYLSCACAAVAAFGGSCGDLTFVGLSVFTMVAASLVSTSLRCDDPKTGKLLNSIDDRKAQAKFAGRSAIGIIIAGMFAHMIPIIGTPLMVLPDFLRRSLVTFIGAFLIIGLQRVAEC